MSERILYGGEMEAPIPVTLGELATLLLQTYGDKILMVDSVTCEEYSANYILEYATRLAKWLYSQGLKKGDIMSIVSENRIEFSLVTFAAILTGVTLAPLNPEYTADELQHVLNLSKPKLIFCSPNTVKRISSVIDSYPFVQKIVVFERNVQIKHNKVLSMERALEEYFKYISEDREWVPPELDTKETIALIMCSSGTTGLPKGVMITQDNLLSFFRILTQITDTEFQEKFDDIAVGLVPFFHSMGFMVMLLCALGGRKLVIMKKFQLKQYLKILQDYKVSVLAVPPPIIVMMCQSPLLKEYDLSNIREVRCGAAPLAKKFEQAIARKLNIKVVVQAYGMTETTLGVLFVPPNTSILGSVGKVVPGMYAKVIDEKGNILGPNEEGELCFKGPLIMKGYINDPISTANTVDKDGWLHTGDVGYYDENNYFYIVDRIKELIKYKGYQVAPAELEKILMNHPDILDAAVVGLPDDEAGELPLAFVVLKANATTTAKEVQDFVKGKVSSQKQLRGGVKFIAAIPRNPSGKILRRVLKQSVIKPKSRL